MGGRLGTPRPPTGATSPRALGTSQTSWTSQAQIPTGPGPQVPQEPLRLSTATSSGRSSRRPCRPRPRQLRRRQAGPRAGHPQGVVRLSGAPRFGYLASNPTEDLRLKRPQEQLPRAFSPDDLHLLVKAASSVEPAARAPWPMTRPRFRSSPVPGSVPQRRWG
jgi:hypothetical protein